MSTSHRILLKYGTTESLDVTLERDALAANLAGPAGVTGESAGRVVAEAVENPSEGPPLAAHAVPGDRAVIAVSGDPPQARAVVAAVTSQLVAAGVATADVSVLHAGHACGALDPAQDFHADTDVETSYLAADDAGRPLHLARALVDADVVVTVGEWAFDSALGGRSLDGELWPAFARRQCQDDLSLELARRGRKALPAWLASLRALTWQLGVTACVRVVAGRDGTLSAAAFGTADTAARRARHLAAAWAPVVDRPADLAICSMSRVKCGFDTLARAVAAAARITSPDGTICIASTGLLAPGPVVTRWRQGAPLKPLLREACLSGDRSLMTDAVATRLLASGLADRRLVLLSPLDETAVEDLGFGFAASPDVIDRLARRSKAVVVLHEADRLFPSLPM